ncbi:MAG: hypothetical protein LBI71_04575 [Enterobacteriaceae bacterium]|jgi:hypothetical protein|nr:hypothetical protein [Enterobacteriaceae bacterium]
MKKILLVCIFGFFSQAAFAGYTDFFETKTYLITIHNLCSEGNVSCDNVESVVKNKKAKTALILKGKTLNRRCDTGSCSFYGYEFKDKDRTYTISRQGALSISRKGKTIFSEKGVFRY